MLGAGARVAAGREVGSGLASGDRGRSSGLGVGKADGRTAARLAGNEGRGPGAAGEGLVVGLGVSEKAAGAGVRAFGVVSVWVVAGEGPEARPANHATAMRPRRATPAGDARVNQRFFPGWRVIPSGPGSRRFARQAGPASPASGPDEGGEAELTEGVSVATEATSEATNSFALSYRSSGAFARARPRTRPTAGGIAGSSSLGASFTCIMITARGVSALKGTRPVNSSYSMTANE